MSIQLLDFIIENKLEIINDIDFKANVYASGSLELFEKFSKKIKITDLTIYACKGGNIEVVKKFIEQGYSPNCLHTACSNKNYKLVDFLLEKGANNYNLGLVGACNANDFELVNKMIYLGANNYCFALENAFRNKDIDTRIIDLLMSKTNLYETVFIHACYSGSLINVKKLMPLVTNILDGFYASCRGGNYEVYLFLKGLVDINVQTAYENLSGYNENIYEDLENLGAKPTLEIIRNAILKNNFKYLLKHNKYLRNIKFCTISSVEMTKFLFLSGSIIVDSKSDYYGSGIRCYYIFRKFPNNYYSNLLRIQNFKMLFKALRI